MGIGRPPLGTRPRWIAGGLLALLALLDSGAASAEREFAVGPLQHSFTTYGLAEGMPSLATTSLARDAIGSLWIGTREGLVRFDGERLVAFDRRAGLPSSRVLAVAVDGGGAVWAGTELGLARLEGERFLPVELPGSAADQPVGALAVDADGRLVAGALGGLYVCSRGGCRRSFACEASERVEAITLDRLSGDLWLAGPFGLVRWRQQELDRWSTTDGLPSHLTRALAVDRYGTLWVRQPRHLALIDTAQRTLQVEELPGASGPSALVEDREGRIWAASDHGLLERDGERWRRIGVENGLPGDGVTAILEDAEGALWVGTSTAGLARWLGRDRFVTWTRATGLPSENVRALARSGDALAIGTGDGLALVDDGRRELRLFGPDEGLSHPLVLSLAPDGRRGLWIGSAGGVAHLDAAGRLVDAGRRSPFPADLAVQAIAVDPEGSVWLGSSAGLWRGRGAVDAIAFERVVLPDGGSAPELVSDLLVDPSGVLWAAGSRGLARLEAGSWKRLGTADGLADSFVTSVARAGDGALWVGYRDAHGVTELRWAGGKVLARQYGLADGLRHNQVSFVRADALGRIWIGTSRGLAVRTPRGFATFTGSDGLQSEDSNANAFLGDEDGTAWIGTPAGAVAARLSRDDLEPRAPLEARILAIEFGGQSRPPANGIEIPYTTRTVEISFSARTFRSPHEVEFRYQLLGLDESPVVGSTRTVRYPALPYGNHRFVVAARTVGEPWGPATDVRFKVLPPWWSTLPARVAALLLAGLLGVLLDRARTRRLRARRYELEAAVAARTRELDASREELERKNDELAHLSLTDPLTGLKNRRYAWEFLAEEVERVDREWATAPAGSPPEARLVFFLMDVDLFKGINDLHGHEIGDRILVEAAERVRDATRIADVAVRWGGEEFLVVARDLPRSEWGAFATRLRGAIARPAYNPSHEIGAVSCTASLGYAAYPFHPEMDLGWQQVLKLADLALYAVKQCGRDADLGVEPGPGWKGKVPQDLLAAQVSGALHLRWGNVARPARG